MIPISRFCLESGNPDQIAPDAELAPAGIRVNAVSPGMIDTEIHAAAGLPDRAVNAVPSIPMRRVGQPAEVADVIVWLLGEGSSYCAGAIIDVAGGR